MSDEPKDPKHLVIREIAGPDRRAAEGPDRKATQPLPKPDRFELLFIDMKNHVDERFTQASESNVENHRKTNAYVQNVANEVKAVKGRIGALEDRVKAVEGEVEEWKTESDQKLKTYSDRTREPSKHDLEAQQAIATEITDRQTREAELAKDVTQIKGDVAPMKEDLASVKAQISDLPMIKSDVASIKQETLSQTMLFKRHLNRLLGNRVVQTLAMIAGTSLATSLAMGHCVVAVPQGLQHAAPAPSPALPTPALAPVNSNPATFVTPR